MFWKDAVQAGEALALYSFSSIFPKGGSVVKICFKLDYEEIYFKEQQTITVPINELINWDQEAHDPYEHFLRLRHIPMDRNEFKENDRLDKTCFSYSQYWLVCCKR